MIADMSGKDVNVIKPTKNKVAVIIGNEGQGVSDNFISIANKRVSIPMMPNVESLNAGIAGSIIMQKLGEVK